MIDLLKPLKTTFKPRRKVLTGGTVPTMRKNHALKASGMAICAGLMLAACGGASSDAQTAPSEQAEYDQDTTTNPVDETKKDDTASNESAASKDSAATSDPNAGIGRTLIINGTVLTMNEGFEVFDNGVVVVEGERIAAVGDAALVKQYPNADIIDAEGGIIMPGMINLHNHLSMVAFRGAAEKGIKNLEDRLFNYFFPLEKSLLNRDLIRISARHAAIEMALGGVTTTTDMYYHEDEVATAVKQVGLRGILGQTVIGFPVVDAAEPFGGLEYAADYLAEWQGDPLITPALAPHAPYTVPSDILLKVNAMAAQYDAPILMHMAEISNEAEMVDEAFPGTMKGRTIVEYLNDLGFLSPRLISAHTIFVSHTDIATLKAKGVGVAHNPKANTKDMSGLSPGWTMYQRGLDIGLGTDGPMSSNQLDILSVMQHAARVARIMNMDVSKYDPRNLVEMATIGGARALNMEKQIGSLEKGKFADIIIVETKSPNMQPNYNPYATLVFAAYPPNVAATMVHGRMIAKDREVLTVDMEAHQKEWNGVTKNVAEFLKGL